MAQRHSHRSMPLALLVALLSVGAFAGSSATAETLDEVIAGDHRDPANAARDRYRHPGETLRFFGIQPDMRVLEILPGAGWYTEILAPYLADQGQLIAAGYGAEHPTEYLRNIHLGYERWLDARPDLYGAVERTALWGAEGSFLEEIADASVDLVLDFRNTHNFIRWGGITEQVYRAYYRVLKPGGVLGIVEHRAEPASVAEESAQHGYVPEAFTIELAERVGFALAGRSEINANAKDTKDHPNGVWTLPPGLRVGDGDRAHYEAIGESDRMTLKFVK